MSGQTTGEKSGGRIAIPPAVAAAGGRLREEAGRIYAEYSRRSVFFRRRVWIIAAWAAIAVPSVMMMLPESNPLGVYPLQVADPADPRDVIISVENQSARTWTNITFVLDDTYQYERKELAPGGRAQLHARRFLRAGTVGRDGMPPSGFRPATLTVRADQGTYRTRMKR